MSEPAVLQDVSEGLLTLTFNRPEALNAIDERLAIDLLAGLRRAQQPEVRCVLLRGAGRAFMAGGDLGVFHADLDHADDAVSAIIRHFHPAIRLLRELPKPVVAAVQGSAAGGGFSLMLACDLVVAAEDAVFTMAYSAIGTTPDGGSTWHLPRLLGQRRALELALLAERFDARQALDWGLVNRVVPAAELPAAAEALARRLAAGPTLAHGRLKQLFAAAQGDDLGAQLDLEHETFRLSARSADFRAGIEAFFGKRKPRFMGR